MGQFIEMLKADQHIDTEMFFSNQVTIITYYIQYGAIRQLLISNVISSLA